MPYIHVRTNQEIDQRKEKELKERLGKAIALLPGKSEQWLMLDFSENCTLYFRGEKTEPLAFVAVKIFGKAPSSAYQDLTAEISQTLFEVLHIEKDHIYINYEETPYWGYNGSNF